MKIEFVSPLEKIFPNKGPRGIMLESTIYKDENLYMQVCIQADVTCKINLLFEGPENTELKSEKFIPAFVADYEKYDDYRIFTENSSTYYPDKLEDVRRDIPLIAGKWYSFWININKGIPSGDYELKVSVLDAYDGGCLASKKQRFTVLENKLDFCDIPISCWIYYDCIATAHKTTLFEDNYFDILKNYFKDAVNHGINTVFVPLFSQAKRKETDITPTVVQLLKINIEDEQYIFDFSILDRFIDLCIDSGYEFYEFSHIASQQGAGHCPQIIANKEGKEIVLFSHTDSPVSDKYIEFLDKLFTELSIYLKNKGIEKKCFFHVSDEPTLQCYDSYIKIANVLRRILPNANIIDALCNKEFADEKILSYPVVSTNHIENFTKSNYEVWAYYCCEQSYDYLSNRFFNFPLLRTRVLGTQLYLNDTKGFLHWAFNYWFDIGTLEMLPVDYVADGNGYFPAGDCFIVYPGKNGKPYNSLREQVFSDSIRDYKSLKTLERLKGKEFVLNLIKSYGFEGFTKYTHDENRFIEFYEKVKSIIKGNDIL